MTCPSQSSRILWQYSSLWSILHSPFASFLGPNIRLRILFSNNLSLRSSLNIGDRVSQPYSANGNIIVLYILIVKSLIIIIIIIIITKLQTINNLLSFSSYTHTSSSTVIGFIANDCIWFHKYSCIIFFFIHSPVYILVILFAVVARVYNTFPFTLEYLISPHRPAGDKWGLFQALESQY